MPRPPLLRSPELPYHVCGRTNHREWFEAPLHEAWRIFCDELYATSILSEARVHAFVLMTNHYHLMISTPGPDLGDVMREFLKRLVARLNYATATRGHLFGGPYYRSLIRTEDQYATVLKYVYRNPVKARACELVEEYRYSTLRQVMGLNRPDLRIDPPLRDLHPFQGTDDMLEQLAWLNEPFRNEQDQALSRALRRQEFKISGRVRHLFAAS